MKVVEVEVEKLNLGNKSVRWIIRTELERMLPFVVREFFGVPHRTVRSFIAIQALDGIHAPVSPDSLATLEAGEGGLKGGEGLPLANLSHNFGGADG